MKDKLKLKFTDITSTKIEYSESGKYCLVIHTVKTKPSCWKYTIGIVSNVLEKFQKPIAIIERNYCVFWHCFIEDHPDGNDYLLCGSDYQGQTVINLTNGTRIDYLPEEAKQGGGFCWALAEISPDKTHLLVEGCYWAGASDLLVLDFTNPMQLPYTELKSFEAIPNGSYSWIDNNTIQVAEEFEIRKSDRVRYYNLSPAEQDDLDHCLVESDYEVVTSYYNLSDLNTPVNNTPKTIKGKILPPKIRPDLVLDEF